MKTLLALICCFVLPSTVHAEEWLAARLKRSPVSYGRINSSGDGIIVAGKFSDRNRLYDVLEEDNRFLLISDGEQKGWVFKSSLEQAVSANTFIDRGDEKMANENYKGAIKDYDAAIRIEPDNARFHNDRGVAYDRLNDIQRAIQDFSKAIELNQEYALAYSNRGLKYMDLKEYQKAIHDFNNAILLGSDTFQISKKRGDAHYALGSYNNAITDYDAASRFDPDNSSLFRSRANAKRMLKQYAASIDDYDRAIALELDDPFVYFERALSNFSLNRFDSSITDFDTYISLDEDFSPAYFLRGRAKHAKGQYQLALSDLDHAIKLNPDDDSYFYFRSYTRRQLADFRGAHNDIDIAIQKNSNNSDYYNLKGSIYFADRNYNKSLELYKQSIDIGSNKYAKANMSFVLSTHPDEASRDLKAATTLAAEALAEHSDSAYALNAFSCVLAMSGKFEEAIEAQRDAMEDGQWLQDKDLDGGTYANVRIEKWQHGKLWLLPPRNEDILEQTKDERASRLSEMKPVDSPDLAVRNTLAIEPELVLQEQHTSTVSSAVYTPDGTILVSGSQDCTIIVRQASSGRILRVLEGHAKGVNEIALAPDGTTLASCSSDNTIKLWNIRSGHLLRSIPSGSEESVAFAPDGSVLVSGGQNQAVSLWDVASGQKIRVLKGHNEAVQSVAFSPDGKTIVSGADDHLIQVWDAQTGRLLHTLSGHAGPVNAVAFSPDGNLIASGSDDGRVRLWDPESGQQSRVLETSLVLQNVESICFSPDGTTLACGGGLPRSIRERKPNPLAVRAATQDIHLWDVKSGKRLRDLEGHGGKVFSVAFSPDGTTVLSASGADAIRASQDVSLRLWDAESGECIRIDGTGMTRKTSTPVAVSPDGHFHASVGPQNSIELWDIRDRRRYQTQEWDAGQFQCLEFSPSGTILAAGTGFDEVILWEVKTGKLLRVLKSSNGAPISLAFGHHGTRLVARNEFSNITIWDVESGEQIVTLESDDGNYLEPNFAALAFDRNGERLASATDGKPLILWDARNAKQLQTLDGHDEETRSLDFGPDGKVLASGSADKTIRVWDTESGRTLSTFAAHEGALRVVAFNPTGTHLASAGDDYTVKVWELKTGKCACSMDGFRNDISFLRFINDGKTLAIGCSNKAIQLWDVSTCKEIIRFLAVGEEDWLAVTPEGLFDGTEAAMQKVCFRIGDGLNVVPVDRFFNDFYRPGLLASIAAGERPLPEQAIGLIPPPTVTLARTNPEEAGSRRVSFKVTATDQGGGISGLRLYHNGARLITQGEEIRNEDGVTREFFVDLVEGENRLRATAFCRDGSMEAEPAELVLKYEKPLDRAKLFVVAVGVSDYQHDPLDLSYADNDATQIAALCRTRGSSLYESVHVQLLTDSKATSENLHAAMEKVREKAEPQDVLMVLLSGHGKMVGQRYFFLPYDIQIPEFGDIDEAIRQGGIPHDRIYGWMTRSPALKRVLILDTCYAGGAVTSADRYFALLDANKARDPFQFRGAIERQSRSSGIYTIAAAAATSKAQEVDELRHGVLSYTLLAAFEGVDGGPLVGEPMTTNNPDGVAEVNDWITYAAGRVPRLMESYFGRRHDVHSYSKGNSFPFLPLSP